MLFLSVIQIKHFSKIKNKLILSEFMIKFSIRAVDELYLK